MGWKRLVVRGFVTVFVFIPKLLVTVYFSILNSYKPNNRKKISASWDELDCRSREILTASVTDLAEAIRTRKYGCREVVATFVTRCRTVQPHINAVVDERYGEALLEAEEVDRQLASESETDLSDLEKRLPLLGVPFTAKVAFAIKGLSQSSGKISRRGVVSTRDADVVSRLRAHGAIPLAVTNCSELCMWYESSNNLHGTTNNPYDTRRMVGGSSGGEGAVNTCAGAAFGLGSDIGGSIRMPAFFCGIYGHKPTQGLISNVGQYPISTGSDADLLTTGPLCRYARDVPLLLRCMAQPDHPLWGSDVTPVDNGEVDVTSLTFYTLFDDGGSLLQSDVSSDVVKAQTQLTNKLKAMGLTVDHPSLPDFAYSSEMWTSCMTRRPGDSFNSLLGDEVPSVDGFPLAADGSEDRSPSSPKPKKINSWLEALLCLLRLSDYTVAAVGLSCVERLVLMSEGDHLIFSRRLQRLREHLETFLSNSKGVLIYPTHPKPALYHSEALIYITNWAYTGIFNALGLPVTQVPLGLTKRSKVPVGVQIVGARGQDHVTAAVARYFEEQGLCGWTPP